MQLEPLEHEPEDELEMPVGVVAPDGVELTKEDKYKARLAVRKAGYTVLDVRKLEANAELGKFIQKLGLFRIYSSKLVVASEDLEVIYAKTVQLEQEATDPEIKAAMLTNQTELMKQRMEAIKCGLKAGAVEISSRAEKPPGSIPFPPFAPVQVNVNAPGSTTEIKS